MRMARTILTLGVLLMAAGACGSQPARTAASRPNQVARTARSAPVVTVRVAAAPDRGAPVRLLFVGASVTSGSGASTPAHAYPAVVAAQLEAAGHGVVLHILARSGVTVGVADTWDLAVPSDLVVVQLATNDFKQDVPLATFSATYNDVLRRVRAASPEAQLICTGGWDDPASVNALGVSAADYDAAAWSACTLDRGRYVDLSATYLDPRNHGPVGRPTFQGPGDHFHPNDRGHQELAARVLASQDLPFEPPPIPSTPPTNTPGAAFVS